LRTWLIVVELLRMSKEDKFKLKQGLYELYSKNLLLKLLIARDFFFNGCT
jgi:hypothetical protein